MSGGFGASVIAVLASVLLAISGNLAAAQHRAAKPAEVNPANEKLEKLSASERAAVLSRAAPNWCIGTETFLMGIETGGAAKNNAYWSLRCVDGSTWAVQVDPLGGITVIDCNTFKEAGAGKECFKKF